MGRTFRPCLDFGAWNAEYVRLRSSMLTDMSHTTDPFPVGQQIAWTPDPQWVAESNLRRFMEREGDS